MSNPTRPQLLSFLICDNVHVDPATRKYTLLGLFTGIQVMQFPATHGRMFIFISLSELSAGDHVQHLSLALPGQDPIYESEQTFQSAGPMQRIQLIHQLQRIEFPHAGDYDFMLEVDDEPILVHAFPVRSVQLPPGMKASGQPGG